MASDGQGRSRLSYHANLLKIALHEVFGRGRVPRVPEPEVMDDAEQVEAYAAAGRDGGTMAPTHLLNASLAIEQIRPGDTVLDLGCGPGIQLSMLALLQPEARFIGVDLSKAMLATAAEQMRKCGVQNVELRQGDITQLDNVSSGSIDVVVSCMTLHHLPDVEHLHRCLAEVARVLKPEGRLYLADLSRLRSRDSMQFLATCNPGRQAAEFTQDYANSLHAAFCGNEFAQAAAVLNQPATLHRTQPIPFLMILRTSQPSAIPVPAAAVDLIHRWRQGLSPAGDADLSILSNMLRLGQWRGRSIGRRITNASGSSTGRGDTDSLAVST